MFKHLHPHAAELRMRGIVKTQVGVNSVVDSVVVITSFLNFSNLPPQPTSQHHQARPNLLHMINDLYSVA